MTRRYLFILTLLPFLAVAGEALAMGATLTAIGNVTTDIDKPISNDQCEANVKVKFEVTNGNPSKYLFVMVGSDCDQDRTELTTDSCTRVLGQSIEGRAEIPISVGVKDLGIKCGTSEGDYTVYFLGHSSESEERQATTDFATVTIEVDTTGPPAPTDVKGGQGESSIPVTWEFGGVEVESFWVYYEAVSSCPGGSILCTFSPGCTPSIDAAVSVSDTDDAGVTTGQTTGQENPLAALAAAKYEEASSSSRKFDLKGVISVGQTAAVAVVAIDEAGNRSQVSNVACIEGIATVGFCEMNEGRGGKCESGCSVSRGPGANPGRLPAALLVLLAVAWISLRRRNDASIV